MLSSLLTHLLLTALTMNEPTPQDQAVILAKQAASQQLNLPVEQFTMLQAHAVDWPDSSLGCSQPGKMYLQVITPGFKVVLKAGEETYSVHVGGARAVLCGREVNVIQGIKAQAAQAKIDLMNRARKRLAAKLKVDPEHIQVHGIRRSPTSVVPDDVDAVNEAVNQEKIAGKRVDLEYQGRHYEYNAESDSVEAHVDR